MTTSPTRLTLAVPLLLLALACGGGEGDPGAAAPAGPSSPSGPTDPGGATPPPPVDPGTPPPPVDPGPTPPATGPAPVITVINRHGSPVTGGEMVLILGANLDTADLVTFGGAPATGVTYDAVNRWLQVIDPPHAEGFVDIVVRLADGQTATFPGFHYGPPPVVTSFTPDTGHRDATVTITGRNFAAVEGVSVSFGVTRAVILSRSPTELVVVVPKMNPGTYPVVVANFDDQFGMGAGAFTMQ